MFKDYHTHTAYSLDSTYPMEEVLEDAIKIGIDEICFTDHVDYGNCRDIDDPRGIEKFYDPRNGKYMFELLNTDYENYFKDIARFTEKYKNQITIKKGLEFGIMVQTIDDYEKLFAKYPLDFVIMSIHQVNGKTFAYHEFQANKEKTVYHHEYYNEIFNIIKKYKNYSVLGHLDSIGRYDKGEKLPFSDVEEIVAEILKIAIADNKGIEINTSSYRYGVGEWTPSLQIVNLYKDLGGKIITVGSDSHCKEHLGAHIPKKLEQLKSLGFEYYCTYDKMMPIFHKL